MARIKYVDIPNSSESIKTAWQQLLMARKSAAPPKNLYTMLAHSPYAMTAWSKFVQVLSGLDETGAPKGTEISELSPRMRKLIILQSAHSFGDQYEWQNHARTAANAAVTSQELEAISRASDHDFNDQERLLLQFVKEACSRKLSDSTFNSLLEDLGERATVEVSLLISFCSCATLFIHAIKIENEQ